MGGRVERKSDFSEIPWVYVSRLFPPLFKLLYWTLKHSRYSTYSVKRFFRPRRDTRVHYLFRGRVVPRASFPRIRSRDCFAQRSPQDSDFADIREGKSCWIYLNFTETRDRWSVLGSFEGRLRILSRGLVLFIIRIGLSTCTCSSEKVLRELKIYFLELQLFDPEDISVNARQSDRIIWVHVLIEIWRIDTFTGKSSLIKTIFSFKSRNIISS